MSLVVLMQPPLTPTRLRAAQQAARRRDSTSSDASTYQTKQSLPVRTVTFMTPDINPVTASESNAPAQNSAERNQLTIQIENASPTLDQVPPTTPGSMRSNKSSPSPKAFKRNSTSATFRTETSTSLSRISSRHHTLKHTFTKNWRDLTTISTVEPESSCCAAPSDIETEFCCRSCFCCEALFARMFGVLRKVIDINESVSTSSLAFYSPYLELIYKRFTFRSQEKSVKNVIRIATIAFIIFFIQDFLTYPGLGISIYRGLTILMGVLFYKYFQYESEKVGFDFSKIFPLYAIVIFSYGFFIIVAAFVRTHLHSGYFTFSPALALWILVVYVMGNLSFKQSSVIVGCSLACMLLAYTILLAEGLILFRSFLADIICYASIGISGAWGAYLNELNQKSNFVAFDQRLADAETLAAILFLDDSDELQLNDLQDLLDADQQNEADDDVVPVTFSMPQQQRPSLFGQLVQSYNVQRQASISIATSRTPSLSLPPNETSADTNSADETENVQHLMVSQRLLRVLHQHHDNQLMKKLERQGSQNPIASESNGELVRTSSLSPNARDLVGAVRNMELARAASIFPTINRTASISSSVPAEGGNGDGDGEVIGTNALRNLLRRRSVDLRGVANLTASLSSPTSLMSTLSNEPISVIVEDEVEVDPLPPPDLPLPVEADVTDPAPSDIDSAVVIPSPSLALEDQTVRSERIAPAKKVTLSAVVDHIKTSRSAVQSVHESQRLPVTRKSTATSRSRGRFYTCAKGVLNAVHVSVSMNREAEKMNAYVNPKLMTFCNSDAEHEFTENLLLRSSNRLKMMLVVLILTTIVFVLQDYYSSPDYFLHTLLPIRFYIIVPALVLCEILVFALRGSPFLMECMMCVCFITVAVGYIIQLFSVPVAETQSALSGVLRIVFLMTTTFSIQFRVAVVSTWIVVILMPIAGFMKGVGATSIVNYLLYLLVLAMCVSWLCYSNERKWKFRFFMDPKHYRHFAHKRFSELSLIHSASSPPETSIASTVN